MSILSTSIQILTIKDLRLFELNHKRGLDDAIMHTKYVFIICQEKMNKNMKNVPRYIHHKFDYLSCKTTKCQNSIVC